MKKNTYNFPVEMVPIEALRPVDGGKGREHIAIPKRFAVVRTDTLKPLGVVSDKYGIVTHGAMIDGFRKAVAGQNVEEKISLTHGGAKLAMKMTFADVRIKVDNGDEVAMQLIAKNSYDGTNALTILFGAFRVVCSNGMIIGRKFIHFSRKHVGDAAEVRVEEIVKQVGMLTEAFERTGPMLKQMAGAGLKNTVEDFFSPKRLRLPEYLAAAARTSFEGGKDQTVWGAYNTLTSVITHSMKEDATEDTRIRYGRNAWEAARREIGLVEK